MTGEGVAFTAPGDGDMRGDPASRRRVSDRLGIPAAWATVEQVHGSAAVLAGGPGSGGPADGIVTTERGLPLAVFTADCLGVVMHGAGVVGVAHAGWRGLAAGILQSTIGLMEQVADRPGRAHIGPSIGPCCFEVGDEVAERFPDRISSTSWGATSVDLRGVAIDLLAGIAVTIEERCTVCGGGPSHRRDGTTGRMAAIGWLS